MTESTSPIRLPTYTVGDEATPDHFAAATPRETAAEEAKALTVGDAAFILRSGHKWTYATVTEKSENGDKLLRFEVDDAKNRKSFPESVWGKYIRMIKVDESEMAKLVAEEAATNAEKEATKAKEAKKEEEAKKAEEIQAESEKKEGAKNKEDERKSKKSSPWASIISGITSMSKKAAKTEESCSAFTACLSEGKEVKALPKDNEEVDKTEESKEVEVESEEVEAESKEVEAETKEVEAKSKNKEEAKEKEDESKTAGKVNKKPSPWTEVANGVSSLFSNLTHKSKFTKKEKKTEEAEPATEKEEGSKEEEVERKSPETKSEKTEGIKIDETPAPSSSPSPMAPFETRDDVEEISASAAALPDPIIEAATPADPAEPPKLPIKLLETPLQFYKASSMKEDPAAAALAATSFCDDHNLQGVVVCESDPASAARAESLARDRLYGSIESQGIIIVETEEQMKKQGVTVVSSVVSSPRMGFPHADDAASVKTEKAAVVAAE